MLFLKYLDDMEGERAIEAELVAKCYDFIIPSVAKGAATRKVWYYQLDPGRNMGKTNPLNDNDLKEFVELQASFSDSDKSWAVDAKDIDADSFDLSVKNPNVEGMALS